MDTNDKKTDLKNFKNNNFIIYNDENENKNEKLKMNIKNRIDIKDEYNSLYLSPGNSSDDSNRSFKSP